MSHLPNVYLYASNNPSEGALAKRRAAATLVSYLTPTLTHAGLYKELLELKQSLERWRTLEPTDAQERPALAELIYTQACALDLTVPEKSHALPENMQALAETHSNADASTHLPWIDALQATHHM